MGGVRCGRTRQNYTILVPSVLMHRLRQRRVLEGLGQKREGPSPDFALTVTVDLWDLVTGGATSSLPATAIDIFQGSEDAAPPRFAIKAMGTL